jgi:hypothetical protein
MAREICYNRPDPSAEALFEEGHPMRVPLVCMLVLGLASSAQALDAGAFQMSEDFGAEPLYDCGLQYYYYIPCPTYSWFWAFSGWSPGDIIGTCFEIGDQGTGGFAACDSYLCQGGLRSIGVLDYAGYGTIYPGLFTFEFDVYCALDCCGPNQPFMHIWNSGPLDTHYGWNYFTNAWMLSLSPCCTATPPDCSTKFVITATMTGTDARYPAWGFDNVSTAVNTGCVLHDIGCLPAVIGRNPCGTDDPMVHSGYIGTYPFEYWPPLPFCDGQDSSADCHRWGAVELAWRINLDCGGHVAGAPTTWGEIKSIYR